MCGLQEKVSSGVPERRVTGCVARGKFERGVELQKSDDESGGEIAEVRDGVLLLKQGGVEGTAGNGLRGLLVFLRAAGVMAARAFAGYGAVGVAASGWFGFGKLCVRVCGGGENGLRAAQDAGEEADPEGEGGGG